MLVVCRLITIGSFDVFTAFLLALRDYASPTSLRPACVCGILGARSCLSPSARFQYLRGRRSHNVCFGWDPSELCQGCGSDSPFSAELPAESPPLPGPSPPSPHVCSIPLSPFALILVAAQSSLRSPSDGWFPGFATGLTLGLSVAGGCLMPAQRLASIPIAGPAAGFVNVLQSCTTCLPGY